MFPSAHPIIKPLNEEEIHATVAKLDAKKFTDQEEPWDSLRPIGESVVPYLLDAYSRFRLWQGRLACVYHSMRFARSSEAAFQLGLLAAQDRATMVRYRACGLLAYSLRREAIPALKHLLKHPDLETRKDAAAEIEAIKKQNHPLFRDRGNSGQVFWILNEEDEDHV